MSGAMQDRWTRRRFISGLGAVGAGATGLLASGGSRLLAQAPYTGDSAMRELMEGNARFIAGKLTSFDHDLQILKEKTVTKQEPFAAVLSCADSRVPVELIFDQSIGHLFVTRVAGNMVTPEIIASLEYGVAVLGLKAIMVMGHTNCGAVSAAISAKEVPGQISVLYQHLIPAIRDGHGNMDASVKANAAFQAALLRKSSTVIAKAIKDSGVKVAGAV